MRHGGFKIFVAVCNFSQVIVNVGIVGRTDRYHFPEIILSLAEIGVPPLDIRAAEDEPGIRQIRIAVYQIAHHLDRLDIIPSLESSHSGLKALFVFLIQFHCTGFLCHKDSCPFEKEPKQDQDEKARDHFGNAWHGGEFHQR